MKIEIVEEATPTLPLLVAGQLYLSANNSLHMVICVDYRLHVLIDLNGGNRRYDPTSLSDLRDKMMKDKSVKFRLFTGTAKLTVGGSDD